jgi:hypothetical protein
MLEKMAKNSFLFPRFLHNGVAGHRGYSLKWYKPCKFCGNPALWNVPFPIFGNYIFVDIRFFRQDFLLHYSPGWDPELIVLGQISTTFHPIIFMTDVVQGDAEINVLHLRRLFLCQKWMQVS